MSVRVETIKLLKANISIQYNPAMRLHKWFVSIGMLLAVCASEAWATLTFSIVNRGCGVVWVNGYVDASDGVITRLAWEWGDGTQQESFFIARHRYAASGTYTVRVTAYGSAGTTQALTKSVAIGDLTAPDCNLRLTVHPPELALNNGHTSETLRVKLQDEQGCFVPMKGRHPLFRSTNPNLIQVDSSGRATATGFGFGDILVAVEGIPGVARTQVCAGTLRLEPPYVRLVAGAQGTVQLKVIGERLYGSRLA